MDSPLVRRRGCGQDVAPLATAVCAAWGLPSRKAPRAVFRSVTTPQALCLLASMFGNEIASLEVDLAALVRSQQLPHPGTQLSVLPRWVCQVGLLRWVCQLYVPMYQVVEVRAKFSKLPAIPTLTLL